MCYVRTVQYYIHAFAHCQLSLNFSCWTYCVFDSAVDLSNPDLRIRNPEVRIRFLGVNYLRVRPDPVPRFLCPLKEICCQIM
jgi:hypothetical protein